MSLSRKETDRKEKKAPADPQDSVLSVIGEMLSDLARTRPEQQRPSKDELLEYLSSRPQKLNLFLLRHLPDLASRMRKDPGARQEILSLLRQRIVALRGPLLTSEKVSSYRKEVLEYTLAEARKYPDLWAARALELAPLKPDRLPPLVDLRLLLETLQQHLESRVPSLTSLIELEASYAFIERELTFQPRLAVFLRRAYELADRVKDAGDVTALYGLLVLRILPALGRMPAGDEKDFALQAVREATGEKDPANLEMAFKQKVMSLADKLMKETGSYEDVLELRFFFKQIGERSNRKLLSKKTGELVRKMDVRSQGYRLISMLDVSELDEDSLIEVVPAVMARAEAYVNEGPLRYLDQLMKFYLKVACPLIRSLRDKPDKVPRLIQNFKRKVGLLNIYRDLDHLAQTFQRKMVLAVCGPRMLKGAPKRILRYLAKLPPEFYPPEVMQTLRGMIRERGVETVFTAGDTLKLLARYPSSEE